jgi:hypothetical protein
MYKYYITSLDKNQIKEMSISKQQLLSIFRDPINGQKLALSRKHISIDWCIHPQISQNLMDRWYMVFDKPPCNNKEMLLYFPRKLWVYISTNLTLVTSRGWVEGPYRTKRRPDTTLC